MPFLIRTLRCTVVPVRALSAFFLALAVSAFLPGAAYAQNAAPAAGSPVQT